eukprot:1044189-Pyramimonas_sp.AAC.1
MPRNAMSSNAKQCQSRPGNSNQCQTRPSNVKQGQAAQCSAKQCQATPNPSNAESAGPLVGPPGCRHK